MKVLIGVTGSIAAYKSAELVRLMKKKGWDVKVAMTESATRFVGKLTFQTLSGNEVAVGLFDEVIEWKPRHISLADWAEVVVIAPCTANMIAKLAHGMADDILSCTVLACRAPLVIAPSMNDRMLAHPATAENLRILSGRGALVIEPGSGGLACGREGKGRMADMEILLDAVEKSAEK